MTKTRNNIRPLLDELLSISVLTRFRNARIVKDFSGMLFATVAMAWIISRDSKSNFHAKNGTFQISGFWNRHENALKAAFKNKESFYAFLSDEFAAWLREEKVTLEKNKKNRTIFVTFQMLLNDIAPESAVVLTSAKLADILAPTKVTKIKELTPEAVDTEMEIHAALSKKLEEASEIATSDEVVTTSSTTPEHDAFVRLLSLFDETSRIITAEEIAVLCQQAGIAIPSNLFNSMKTPWQKLFA
jgi:hypothetical protein